MRNRLLRFLTMATALALILSAAPLRGGASGGGTPRRNTTTVMTAGYKEPAVRVIVPTTGAVFINPYQSRVKIGTEDEAGQIISVPSSIANLSRMPLQVDVTVSGKVLEGSDMVLSSSSTKDSGSTTKKAFMFFEMKNVNASQAEDPESVRWDGYTEGTDIIVSATSQKTKKNMVILAAADISGEVTPNGSAAFHLDGDAVKNPKNAWSVRDGVQVTVSFSFKPLPCF